MINVTDTIKEAYLKSTTQYDKIVLDDEEYPINNVELDDDCYEEGNIFGTAIAKALSFEIDSSVDLEGKEFKYFTGIKTTTGIEWIDLGTYITQEVEPNDTTKINIVNAMDYMLKTNIEYTSNLQYSNSNITLGQVAQEACNKAGVILATTDFPNATFIVDSNQFEQGTLIRQVIQAIAQISGTVAKVRSDDKLYFITPKITGTVRKVFDLSDYSEVEIKRATHPINLVSLGMSDIEGENVVMKDEQSISTNGENSLVINDNPFAYTEAKRQQLITAIFNAVKGFEYKAYEMTGQGLPYIETLDNVQLKDFEGNIYNSFLFRYYHKSPNGLETEMSAPSIIKATVDYQNVANAEQIAKRTEIIVNKQEQRITQLASKQGEYDSKLTQVEQSVEEISQQVSEIADFTRTIQENNQIYLNETVAGEGYVLDFSIQGSTTNFIYLAPKDGLAPSDTLAPLGGYFTLVSDKQNRTSMSEEAQITRVVLDEPLRNLNDVYDEFKIVNGIATVIRRIGVNSDLTLHVLEEEVVEELGELQLKTFDTDTYIYVQEYYNLVYSAKYIIKNDYSENFVTNYEANSMINQASNRIEETVSENFATKDELIEESSQRIQTAQEITQEVSKKVGEDEIISSINQSAEEVQINANKISLEGAVTVNGGFEIDEEGNMIAKNGTFTGGNIKLSDDGNIANATLTISNDGNVNSILSNAIYMLGANENVVDIYNAQDSTRMGLIMFNKEQTKRADFTITDNEARIQLYHEGSSTVIRHDSIQTPILYQTSLEDSKKNFEKLENGLDIIKATDIYKYNLKSQADSDKKHIGFVIGKNHKYSSEITAEDEEGKEVGVDTYSMISVAYRAIQEQQEMIEKLQDKITKLEEK